MAFCDDGYETDNVLANNAPGTKKKNSKNKGSRGERDLVKQFNQRFQTQVFARVVGSGNRWGQVAFASKDYIGDLVCPDNFRFSIECKIGYPDIDLCRIFSGGDKLLDSFLDKATKDAERVDKEPLLCWRKNYQQWIAFLNNTKTKIPRTFTTEVRYEGWVGLSLENLFSLDDKFFFV